MTAAVIALAVLAAGLAAALVTLTFRFSSAVRAQAKSEIGASHFECALELAHFELEQTRRTLSATVARAAALEDIIAEDLNATAPNADLARSDIRGRLLRNAQAWAAADRARAAATEDVPSDGGSSSGTSAAVVPALGASDVREGAGG